MQIADYLTIEALDHIDGDVGQAATAPAVETAQYIPFKQGVQVIDNRSKRPVKGVMVMLIDGVTREPYHQVRTGADGIAMFDTQLPMGVADLLLWIKPEGIMPYSGQLSTNPSGTDGQGNLVIEAQLRRAADAVSQLPMILAVGIGGILAWNLWKKYS